MVSSFEYFYFDDSAEEYKAEEPKLPNKLWSQTDSRKLGRCFTTIPTSEHVKLGIQKIIIGVKARILKDNSDSLNPLAKTTYQNPTARLFFHSPDMFLTVRENTELLQQHEIYLKKSYEVDVKHKMFNTLGNGKKKTCSMDPNYSKDNCANIEVEKESIGKFGCTSPFGLNKTKICQNADIISKGLNHLLLTQQISVKT